MTSSWSHSKLLSLNKQVLFDSFPDVCEKLNQEQAFYISNSTKPNCKQQAQQFTLKAIHGLHKLRGLNTNTLNPGDLSEPSVIVYV